MLKSKKTIDKMEKKFYHINIKSKFKWKHFYL